METLVKLICQQCGNEFERLLSQTHGNRGQYCSVICRQDARHNGENRTCKICSKVFYAPSSQINRIGGEGAKYCSMDCYNKAKSLFPRKDKIMEGGYIRIWCPSHPKARFGRQYEHILIWEEANGRSLPDGWVVHHLNGIKIDNRIENLMAMPNKKHTLLIPALEAKIRDLESVISGYQDTSLRTN